MKSRKINLGDYDLKKNKIFLCFVLPLVSILLFLTWYFLDYGQYIDQNSIFVNSVSINGNEIVLEGDTSNSALAFTGYKHRFEGENLIIKYRYASVNPFNRLGNFRIAINQGEKKVQKILIEGSEEGIYKQVWPSTEVILPEVAEKT